VAATASARPLPATRLLVNQRQRAMLAVVAEVGVVKHQQKK